MRERVLGSMRERVLGISPYGVWNLAVWPLESGRVASGLSPRGVSSFVHARLGVRGNQGRMVCNLPSPCPHTCSRPPVVPHVPSPRGVEIAFLAGFHGALSPLVASGYEPRRQAVANAPCGTGFGRAGVGLVMDRKRFHD